jgi:hypothetical protein
MTVLQHTTLSHSHPQKQSLPGSVFFSGSVSLIVLCHASCHLSEPQAARDAAASRETLIHLFERIHFFLQRLKSYTRIPLTEELTELLGKIMAQLLSILALSAKMMTDNRISELILSLYCPVVNYASEMFLKRLMGRTKVEDALLRLDSLTREESLMTLARTLEVTHRIDNVVCNVDGGVRAINTLTEVIDENVKVTKALTEDVAGNVNMTKALAKEVGDNVKVVEGVARGVDNNMRANRHGMQTFSVRLHPHTDFFPVVFRNSSGRDKTFVPP